MLILSQNKYQAIVINGERKYQILEDNHAPKRGPYECFVLVWNVPELTSLVTTQDDDMRSNDRHRQMQMSLSFRSRK